MFGLDGGGIRNFSRALESVDKEEPEAAEVGLPEFVEKVRVMFVTEEKVIPVLQAECARSLLVGLMNMDVALAILVGDGVEAGLALTGVFAKVSLPAPKSIV